MIRYSREQTMTKLKRPQKTGVSHQARKGPKGAPDARAKPSLPSPGYQDLLDPPGEDLPRSGPFSPRVQKGIRPPKPANATPPDGMSKTTCRLLKQVQKPPIQLCSIMSIGHLKTSRHTIHFTARDRIDVLTHLLANHPELSIHQTTPKGETMVTTLLLNSDLTTNDQIRLINHLADAGADLNQPGTHNEPPLEMAIRLPVIIPKLLNALKARGATFGPAESYAVTALLTGFGGSVTQATSEGQKELPLDGLSSEHAAVELEPVFRDALTHVQKTSAPPLQQALRDALKAWESPKNCDGLVARLSALKTADPSAPEGPGVFLTGWAKPSGHVVGFVLHQEPGGVYLYACNTGRHKDRDRSVVKYEISDLNKTLSFFKACRQHPDTVKKMFVEDVDTFGLRRCDSTEQLPDAIDKSSQKRGNCPVAARKACLLAALWSSSRKDDVEPALVKATYKQITTHLRQVGVQQAMAHQHRQLMGKALVSMLTKFDRPSCQTLAYHLALAIERGVPTPPDTPAPPTSSAEYINTLRDALALSGQDLKTLQTRGGQSLADYAQSRGNTEAFDILTTLQNAT